MTEPLGILIDRVEPRKAKVLISDTLFNEGYPILNSMVKIPFLRNSKECEAIGFITNFFHVNEFFETPELSKYVKTLSGHPVIDNMVLKKHFLVADVELVSAFTADGARTSLDSAIKIGTPVFKIKEDFPLFLTNPNIKYLGTFYGESIPQPLYLSDFQELGEAYHFCIAGQTGSGKSTLAKMLLSLYAKVSPKMNFIIIDPVGEFANAFKGGDPTQKFNIDMKFIWESLKRPVEIYDPSNLIFDRWELFRHLIIKEKIFDKVRIKNPDKMEQATDILIEELRRQKVSLESVIEHIDKVVDIISSEEFAKQIYAGEKYVNRTVETTTDEKFLDDFLEKFKKIASKFAKDKSKRKVSSVIRSLINSSASPTEKGRTIVFDLSTVDQDNTQFKLVLVREICYMLYQESLDLYRERSGKNFNTLVVLDEAHNFAPASYLIKDNEELRRTSEKITKAFIETRKFGLGWMVISTRIGNLEKKLYEHSRVKILGFGLHMGSDRDLILETFGRDIIHRYSVLPDPTDPLLNNKEIAFLIDGPITVLSRNSPEFIKIFNSVEEFLRINDIISPLA